jgi:hypothetical protein
MRQHVAAAARYRSEQDGIMSWHCFSAGAHYDPGNMSFGPIVGVDEHLVAPQAGFDWHAHRGVHIVSWVLEGTLRHEDSTGEVRFVGPGALLVQATGTGIRHAETNASDNAPLRFIQTTIVGTGESSVSLARPPVRVAGVTINVERGPVILGGGHDTHVLVMAPGRSVAGHPLDAGDSLRVDDEDSYVIDGVGELLVATVEQRIGDLGAHS